MASLTAAPDTGSSSFVLISTMLVQLMTPALGLFYGGFVRARGRLVEPTDTACALQAHLDGRPLPRPRCAGF